MLLDCFSPAQQLEAQELVLSYWESGNTTPQSSFPQRPTVSEPDQVNLAVVRISGDSHTNKFVIPLSIPNTDITFNALVDTGSQECFIDNNFAKSRSLLLSSKASPICCVAVDGTPGVGGLVDQELIGSARFGNS